MNEREALKLICLARYARERVSASDSQSETWRSVFRSTVKVLAKVMRGEISPDLLAGLDEAAERIVKNCFNSGNSIDNHSQSDRIKLGNLNEDGGPGSGNHGHKGVKGQRGGSAPSGSGNSGSGGNSSKEARKSTEFSEKAYKKALIGTRTSDGKTIKGITTHAMSRMRERNVYPKSVQNAIKNTKPAPGNIPGRSVYDYKGTRVVIEDSTSRIWTVIYRGKGRK